MSYNLVRMFIAEGMVNRGFLDRMTNVTYAARNGTPLCRLEYAYDPDGLVTQRVVATASGAVTNAYAYDGLMRLVSESDSLGNAASYAYDLCGNRLSVTAQGGTTSVTYTHNRRDADTCDAAGNVTQTVNAKGQTLDLTWNLQRQLVSVSTNGVFAESYAYDPLGRRVSTTDMSGTVYHAYDGIHCVADLDGDGNILRAYTWGAGVDNLLAVTFYNGESTNTLYAVTDPLGTVHAMVDASGTVSVSYTYDSWGNLLSASGSDSLIASLRFTWQGREYSHAAGLYNFRARWYDPAAGRWLSKDPIGLEGGLNLYEAFGNNPVCFMDPLGYSFFGTCWSGIRTGATAVYDASAAVGGVVVDAAAAVGKVTADVAGKTWAAGNTAIGVVAGGVIGGGFIPGIGADISIGNNAIQFENVWFMRWGSITLGNCILYEYGENANSPCTEGRLCDHERQHTYQAEVLGPFYLFAHLYYGLKAVILDKDWHGDSNILEKGPQSIPPRPWWW